VKRATIFSAIIFFLVPLSGWSAAQSNGRSGAEEIHRVLSKDISGMKGHVDNCKNNQLVITDAEKIRTDYDRLIPVSGTLTPSDQEKNRQLAQETFTLLSRASSVCGSNPMISRALMNTYLSIGDFYQNHGAFYPSGATIAYWGADRRARFLRNNDNSGRFDPDLERFAKAWAAASYVDRAIYEFSSRDRSKKEQPYIEPQYQESRYSPVELSAVDEGKLTAEQKELYRDVRAQFLVIAPKVNDARILLDQLSSRLASQNMKLNVQDAAAAVTMQKFLEEAAEYVRAGDFEKAKVALTRSDYMRNKLKSTTGQ
jgi:hypothetical protein